MNWFLTVAIFITSWSVLLFIMLPIGNVAEDDPVPGQVPSAPKRVFWRRKMLATAVLSVIVTTLLMWMMKQNSFAASSPLLEPPPRPAQGDTTLQVTPCRNRVAHQPAPDVAYRPGTGVAPADAGLNAAATDNLEHPQIGLYAPGTGRPPIPAEGPQGNAPAAMNPRLETYTQLGTVQVVGNQALLDGVPLAAPDACPD